MAQANQSAAGRETGIVVPFATKREFSEFTKTVQGELNKHEGSGVKLSAVRCAVAKGFRANTVNAFESALEAKENAAGDRSNQHPNAPAGYGKDYVFSWRRNVEFSAYLINKAGTVTRQLENVPAFSELYVGQFQHHDSNNYARSCIEDCEVPIGGFDTFIPKHKQSEGLKVFLAQAKEAGASDVWVEWSIDTASTMPHKERFQRGANGQWKDVEITETPDWDAPAAMDIFQIEVELAKDSNQFEIGCVYVGGGCPIGEIKVDHAASFQKDMSPTEFAHSALGRALISAMKTQVLKNDVSTFGLGS